MKYLFTGGGTGGHIFPALAIAHRARQIDADAQILFVGTERGIENRVVEPQGFSLATVEFSGFAGQSFWRKVAVLGKLVTATRQALGILTSFQPDVVLGVGGYASLPILVAAALRRIPVVLHEQNACPGLANRVAAHWAGRICISMAAGGSGFGNKAVVLTGNPVRQELFNCRPWNGSVPQLLVFGGSQGAAAVNGAMVAALPQVLEQFPGVKIIHQTGRNQMADVVVAYNDLGIDRVEVVEFIEDMPTAYAHSQLVICRSGATTVAELAACGRGAILIPLPQAAADHQTCNARAMVDGNAALLLPQSELNGERLAQTIIDLLHRPERLHEMGQHARHLSAKGAADLILNECRMLVQKRK
ncbi:MAG: undecaprenyldiphospho-muramoylpentapeptide beta-N-acetylglucosaminyltransferase [Thermodesulfobacteriota bacterium]|nr:undecaprenyldiphospho-muramoylpentapeptide beta-N-acetylglucosaminyltransferase [Thermodesulfobacteriota bacterium]